MEGEIGRVSGISTSDPECNNILFDKKEIREWFIIRYGDEPLPSSWMKRVVMCVDNELDELTSKTTSLFYDAVMKGDLRTVRLLINHHGVDVNECIFEDFTALELAIKEGQKEIVQFIIDQPQTELEKPEGSPCYRAIHHAIIR